jgi:hypothetical protein
VGRSASGRVAWKGIGVMPAKGKGGAAMTIQDAVRAAVDGKFPSLGDASKRYKVELSEPEINAVHAAFGFVQGASKWAGFTAWWEHYGPTLEALSTRLGNWDD